MFEELRTKLFGLRCPVCGKYGLIHTLDRSRPSNDLWECKEKHKRNKMTGGDLIAAGVIGYDKKDPTGRRTGSKTKKKIVAIPPTKPKTKKASESKKEKDIPKPIKPIAKTKIEKKEIPTSEEAMAKELANKIDKETTGK